MPLVQKVGPGKLGKEMKQKSSRFERKEEIKLYIFVNDMTLSRKSNESTKMLFGMFIKVAEHKINIQKSIVFPYTSNENSK